MAIIFRECSFSLFRTASRMSLHGTQPNFVTCLDVSYENGHPKFGGSFAPKTWGPNTACSHPDLNANIFGKKRDTEEDFQP